MKKKSNIPVTKATEKSRDRLMRTQLNRLGKVGGIKDSRFGVRDKSKSEQEKYLQRHIVERLVSSLNERLGLAQLTAAPKPAGIRRR